MNEDKNSVLSMICSMQSTIEYKAILGQRLRVYPFLLVHPLSHILFGQVPRYLPIHPLAWIEEPLPRLDLR